MDNKKYLITYKDGQKDTVTGRITFFTNDSSGMISKNFNIHLNSDTVRSVVEVETEGKAEDGSTE